MLEKIQIYICICAALAVTVMGIIQETPLDIMTARLIFFIIFFYFIGLFVRAYLRKNVFVAAIPIEEPQAAILSPDMPPAHDTAADAIATDTVPDATAIDSAEAASPPTPEATTTDNAAPATVAATTDSALPADVATTTDNALPAAVPAEAEGETAAETPNMFGTSIDADIAEGSSDDTMTAGEISEETHEASAMTGEDAPTSGATKS